MPIFVEYTVNSAVVMDIDGLWYPRILAYRNGIQFSQEDYIHLTHQNKSDAEKQADIIAKETLQRLKASVTYTLKSMNNATNG